MITLTQQERTKFADYLEQEALSDDGVAKQMGDMMLHTNPSIVQHYRMQAAMKMNVVKYLRSIEDMSVGG